MKILAVSDTVDPRLYDYFRPDHFADIELILSCGDLPANYLSFLVTMINVPLYYVRGNHDLHLQTRQFGGEDIHGRLVKHKGIRIAGFEGCMRYTNEAVQYTEREMRFQVLKLAPRIWLARGVDIVVAHAPPRGINDGEDYCHRGFQAFCSLIEKYQPAYFLHGHQHLAYSRRAERVAQIGRTKVINCDGFHIFEYSRAEL